MSENSKIEWTDHTFNPWEGCQKVGPGCDHCYAETRNARFAGGQAVNWGPGAPRRRTSPANWRKPLAWNAAHAEFLAQHGRRQRVFCASLADVFDNAVDPQWRADLFDLIEQTPNLDWLLLTKRIGNVGNMLPVPFDFEKQYPNVWLGATITSQAEADRDIPKLLALDATVRFLSMEPLLGPVNLGMLCTPNDRVIVNALTGQSGEGFETTGDFDRGIDWVIVGGESGPRARPMSIQWARELRDQCAAASVPFLFKQWGEWAPARSKPSGASGRFAFGDYEHERTHFVQTDSYPRAFDRFGAHCVLERVGKKAAGRLLDGVQHDGFPA
jgi:protein gp37